ncbi:hypothetical protein NOF04DRAFT_1044131 [Fusarium oxysporum II5]|nr:hypothetical protein NOF04DRAFT_1044131 [Fusarium oxysporum II5]
MQFSFLLSAVALASSVSAQATRYCCSINDAGEIVMRDGYTRNCCGANTFHGSKCTVAGNTTPFDNCCRGNRDIGVCT